MFHCNSVPKLSCNHKENIKAEIFAESEVLSDTATVWKLSGAGLFSDFKCERKNINCVSFCYRL